MAGHDPDFERWPATNLAAPVTEIMPGWVLAIWRGIRGRCPRCGAGRIFNGYLKVSPKCSFCKANLGDLPADDAPPYFAMVVVLQFLAIFVVLFFKGYYHPGNLMCGFLLISLACICMVALRLAKGAVIGILLKLGLKREVLNA
jgi:uncharacterized protein (DUF983 family)